MSKIDGASFSSDREVGQFVFAAIGLDHGHIYGMCNGLIEAGGILKSVYDPDLNKVNQFVKVYPNVKKASCEEEILLDEEVMLVAGATIPTLRCELGLRVMDHGKDYFTDKAPFTTLEQLLRAREKVVETKRKYMVYYSERIHSEAGVYAGRLIKEGAIGKVLQVIGLGPHRLNAGTRPNWFFEKEKYGGILCDIGSHQIEQYLYYADCKDASVVRSQVANYNHPEYKELEDFGEAMLVGDNGTTNYFRVDWFTPNGLGTWGDGRTLILGTDGYIELRKYIDIGREKEGNKVYLVNHDGEKLINVNGLVGYPFFSQLIFDCINRTETAMTQAHCFKAAELCLLAQAQAIKLK